MSDTTPRSRSGWSASTKHAFAEIVAAHPGLDAVKLRDLYSACDLLSDAEKMQRQVNTDGLMVAGSMAQSVAHPLIAEIRQYRKAALEALKSLRLDGRSGASAAASALATKRWSSRGRAIASTQHR